MYGYRIRFEGLPQICWAAETQVDNYNWKAEQHDACTVEISTIKAKKHTMMVNGKVRTFHNTPLITCVVGNEETSDYADPGVNVRITTIAVRFPKLEIECGEFLPEDCMNDSVILLPRLLEHYSEEHFTEINLLLHNFIKHSTKDTLVDYSTCLSLLFQAMTKIDTHVRKNFLVSNEKSYHYYIRKINHIVNQNYATKLTQNSIAKELGISSCYLSTMYKKATGQTFSEYLLQTRMNHATELLETSSLTTAQIAVAVGFEDESHFRKRFKEYFGMNVREYKYIQKGMTLYHPKPNREE